MSNRESWKGNQPLSQCGCPFFLSFPCIRLLVINLSTHTHNTFDSSEDIIDLILWWSMKSATVSGGTMAYSYFFNIVYLVKIINTLKVAWLVNLFSFIIFFSFCFWFHVLVGVALGSSYRGLWYYGPTWLRLFYIGRMSRLFFIWSVFNGSFVLSVSF